MTELSIWEKAMGWRKRQMVESQLNNDEAYTGKHIGKEIAHRIDPPQRTWVGLTNQERADCWETIPELAMRKVEAKLKEKNT